MRLWDVLSGAPVSRLPLHAALAAAGLETLPGAPPPAACEVRLLTAGLHAGERALCRTADGVLAVSLTAAAVRHGYRGHVVGGGAVVDRSGMQRVTAVAIDAAGGSAHGGGRMAAPVGTVGEAPTAEAATRAGEEVTALALDESGAVALSAAADGSVCGWAVQPLSISRQPHGAAAVDRGRCARSRSARAASPSPSAPTDRCGSGRGRAARRPSPRHPRR